MIFTFFFAKFQMRTLPNEFRKFTVVNAIHTVNMTYLSLAKFLRSADKQEIGTESMVYCVLVQCSINHILYILKSLHLIYRSDRNYIVHLRRFTTINFPARNPPENSPNLGVSILSNELPPHGDKIGSHPHSNITFPLPT